MTYTRYILLFAFLLTAGMGATAQMKRADEAFKHHHYLEAIELYEQAIRRDLDNDQAITNMAIALWRTNQLLQAEYWFTRAALMNEDPEVKLMFAQVLIANEKYELAAKWLEKYMAVQTNDEKLHHARQVLAWANGLHDGARPSQDMRVTPAPINSPDLDFSPVFAQNKLYFTTNRKGVMKRSGEYDPWTGGRFTDVFVAERTGENEFSEPEAATDFPLTAYHEGPFVFSPDGNELFITTSDIDERARRFDAENNTRVQIKHYLRDINGNWVQSKALPFLNSDYSTSHPAISPDGNTLVFASDRPGGKGGMDLYRVTRNERGNWSKPSALGEHINTRGSEAFPYIDANGDLYFSSNWHPGFGGLDIFRCAWDGENWGMPENVGQPINGARDDFGLVIEPGGHSGFFSSNRNFENGDDILFFKRTVGVRIEGRLVDCSSGRAIGHAQVELRGKDYYRDFAFTDAEGFFSFTVNEGEVYEIAAQHERFRADDACTGAATCDTRGMNIGERTAIKLALAPDVPADRMISYLCGKIVHGVYGNPLSEAQITLIDENGYELEVTTGAHGAFFIEAQTDATYEVIAQKDAFMETRETITVTPQEDQCHSVSVALEPNRSVIPPPLPLDVKVTKGMVLELYHVYFDLGKSSIRQDAVEDLETFLQIMAKFPGMRGEIMAHTDSRADDDFNMKLSQQRAEAVQNWLVERGVDPKRLEARGYGETQLVNTCADGVDCTEEEHQRNRRVEFRIIDLGEEVVFESVGY